MTPLQHELARWLRHAVAETGARRVVYRTEYLGYLPFGQYHWVTLDGTDVSLEWPEGWERQDLEALADAGVLVRVSHWVNPQDECERESQYDVAESDAEPAAAPDPADMWASWIPQQSSTSQEGQQEKSKVAVNAGSVIVILPPYFIGVARAVAHSK